MSTTNRFLPALAMLGLAAIAAPSHAQLFPMQTDPNVFRCESVNSRDVTCRIPDGRIAEFVEQHSSSPCTLGRTYWINQDAVKVTDGCRASFRLVDVGVVGSAALTAELRTQLAATLASKIRSDLRFTSTPSVSLQTDRQRAISSTQVGFDGTARVSRSGNYWRTVEFTSVYDLRSRAFTNLDYWTEGTRTGGASERRELLRDRLDDAMEDKLESEFRNVRGANPRFELLTDEETALSSTQSNYTGTGRISIDGREWANVNFESVYDWRTNRFTQLAYRRSTGQDPGVGMDADAERSLEAALAAEVRRQLGSGIVQVAVNRRYRSVSATGKVTYTGKFGYSYNDGDWVTRGYEAVLNPAGYNVRELRIFRISN